MVTQFWHIVSGVGFLYVVASWSKMSQRDIVEFHPFVGRLVGGATFNALLTCASSVSYHAWYIFFHVLKKFFTLANFALMVDFSSCVYGTRVPFGLNLLRHAGVEVVGAMLRWKGCWESTMAIALPLGLDKRFVLSIKGNSMPCRWECIYAALSTKLWGLLYVGTEYVVL